MERSVLARSLIAFLFAAPAAYAGYCATLSLVRYGVSSDAWRHILAVIVAVAIAATVVARLAVPVGTARRAN
jgi:hypothetical protein